MPCQYYTDHEQAKMSAEDLVKVTRVANMLTRHLCSTLEKLEQAGELESFTTPTVQKWWRDHKKRDEERRKTRRLEQMKQRSAR